MATATKKRLITKLLELQKGAKPLIKDAKGQVGDRKTTYLTLNKLFEEVLPQLNEAGILLVQSPATVDGTPVLRTRLINVESPNNEVDEVTAEFPLLGDNPQKQGSALTYARRYSLVSMLGLLAEEDDDGAAASQSKDKPKSSGTKSDDEDRF